MTPSRLATVIVGVAFFVSGAAALVYQVTWQRILALHSGVGIYSIAMIVASFMAGLGIGSQAASSWSARVRPRHALLAFAGLELAIGAFGLASCPLFYDLLYERAAHLYAVPWQAGLMHFLALLVPTGLMGMSLPFLVRGLVRDAALAGRTVGRLYGLNMLGAGVGAFLGPWVLVRHFGVRGAVAWAAAGNLLAAIGAFWLWWRGTKDAKAPAASPRAPLPQQLEDLERGAPLATWLALYAFSGFCALALEIIWFRMVDVAVKTSAFTFGTVLGLYLVGAATGALLGSVFVARVRQPLLVFVRLQCAILVWSGLVAVLLVRLPADLPVMRWLYEYWSGAEGFRLGTQNDVAAVLHLYVLLPLVLFGLPTLLMGASFPILQRAVHDDPETSSRKVGLLQAANIAGCTLGSLVVGLVLLGSIGTTGTLRVLLLAGLVFVAVGARRGASRREVLGSATALVLLACLVPGQDAFWRRLHGQDQSRALVAEDATSVVALNPTDSGAWLLLVNGTSNSALPYAADSHTMLGAIPAVVHPAPRQVAVVGLGSGNTAWAAACRSETEQVRVFEIAAPQMALLRAFDRQVEQTKLRRFLTDPRVTVTIEDGRNAIEREGRLYDLIEADALRPWTAYSGNLYSEEFFQRCARRLAPGGVMCTWAPTPRVVETFARVFPGAIEVGEILVGGREPIPLEIETWLGRARSEPVVEHLGNIASRQLVRVLPSARRILPRRPSPGVNRDLFPRDELATPGRGSDAGER